MAVSNPKFSFLPWMRQGVAAQIEQEEAFGNLPGPFQVRATAPFRLAIDAVPVGGTAYQHTGEEHDIVQHIQLFGPGEVIGIERQAIVKTEPEAGVGNYEPNYLPYIEFYEEDFPWRYTPAKATEGKLRPWITLLVLEREEFEKKSLPDSLLPAITHGKRPIPFPDASQTWAWAHVHINKTMEQTGAATNAGQLYNIIHQENPNLASSRLLCSRKLKPNTPYYAFLIPAFEQGRLAGLGATNDRIIEEDVRKSSWDEHQPDEYANVWPFYFEYSFHTGEELDFEFLVRLIEPRVLADDIGRRPMDCSDAGYEIRYLAGSGDRKGILDLEGALQSPVAENNYEKVLGENDVEKKQFVRTLRDFLNLNTDLKEPALADNFYTNETEALIQKVFEGDEAIDDDPIVLPPLYGQWHAEKDRINYRVSDTENPTDFQKEVWFNQVNLDPRNRAGAGLGTQVVQKNQEVYMDSAWGQVGEVLKAMRQMKLVEMSIEASTKLFNKHFAGRDSLSFIGMTSKIHSKLKFEAGRTLANINNDINTSAAIIKQAFSKVIRPGGPLAKKGNIGLKVTNDIYNQLGQVSAKPAPSDFGGNAFNLLGFGEALAGATEEVGNGLKGGSKWEGVDLAKLNDLLKKSSPAPGAGAQLRSAPEEGPDGLKEDLNAYFFGGNWDPNFNQAQSSFQIFLGGVQERISEEMNPKKVLSARAWAGITVTQELNEEISVRNLPVIATTPEEVIQVMAYPKFTDPMYLALKDLSEAYFLPGLEKIPENTFSILETNQRFIEAYMLGLNHEMARELLWREYPTDQKGSYFRKFWDDIDGGISNLNDIKEITSWRRNEAGNSYDPLGHNHPNGAAAANRLVFVVRGELLKKFPNTVIYLQRAFFNDNLDLTTLDPANWPKERPRTIYKKGPTGEITDQGAIIMPAFKAKADPDITFIGFNISPESANGDKVTDPGYFVVVKERPGEPRFGFDLPVPNEPTLPPTDPEFTWNDGNWEHIGLDESGNYIQLEKGQYAEKVANITETEQDKLKWAKNAAHMAGILYQLPYMVAIHADAMISDEILGK